MFLIEFKTMMSMHFLKISREKTPRGCIMVLGMVSGSKRKHLTPADQDTTALVFTMTTAVFVEMIMVQMILSSCSRFQLV
ncbi:hypothetical protein A3H40_02690 [Candidatus Daviesbacteria bacterium RIFCSPLOWO2_02_FULL_38_15]|uniref:Uncharacterized protein n=1 Tax=Candidatus Daviesbacteria bacterium RIFCSPLOWO2_02_FULL_38_15 TaxID=1797794 RepID=A0A1F5N508_9BACT|nr:MAG: hypothetical protein A3H40_02690 [Candidatus Daviesbacteria bacterium RIFCSPLOWO2_02_FULL_38_15]